MSDKTLAVIGVIVVVTFLVAAVLGISALITMWAWNLVMPTLFHLPKISFLVALGINLLLSLIKPAVTITKSNE